jgi:hypothetical protein
MPHFHLMSERSGNQLIEKKTLASEHKNTVRYARERFWKGETFIDMEDVWRRSQRWCRDVAGRSIEESNGVPQVWQCRSGGFWRRSWGLL